MVRSYHFGGATVVDALPLAKGSDLVLFSTRLSLILASEVLGTISDVNFPPIGCSMVLVVVIPRNMGCQQCLRVCG